MRKFAVGLFFGLAIALTIKTTPSLAQENVDDKFSFGKVVSVAAGTLTVKEYDFAKDADVDVSYSVTTETEFGNVNAVTDLVVNDDVVIDYVEKDGKRVVMTLVKEDKGAEAPAGNEAPMDMPPAEGVNAEAANTDAPAAAPAMPQ